MHLLQILKRPLEHEITPATLLKNAFTRLWATCLAIGLIGLTGSSSEPTHQDPFLDTAV